MADIYIPSYQRPNLQHTLNNFPADLLHRCVLVVQKREASVYEKVAEKYGTDILVLPDSIRRLSPTYEYIIQSVVDDKFFIVDDDLRFAYREDACFGEKKLTPCGPRNIWSMYKGLVDKLDTSAHVGLSARSGNNHVEVLEPGNTWAYNTRMMCFTGYQTEIVQRVKSNRVACRDDFDRHLQLIRMGYPNAVWYDYCHDQPGSNSAGGCSDYRDSQMLKTEAFALAELHPGFVKVTEKKTKADWGVGGTRTDVTVYWKKAFDKGQYK